MSEATEVLAKTLVEYVCEWVETAGRLEGKRGQRNLSFSLIVDREGNQRPAYEAMIDGVQTRLDEFVSALERHGTDARHVSKGQVREDRRRR